MQLHKVGLSALLAISAAVTPFHLKAEAKVFKSPEGVKESHTMPFSSLVPSQTVATNQSEAEQLIKEGYQQYQANKPDQAIQSWQKALTLYREKGDRRGEGNTLAILGIAYDKVGNYAKAVELYEQSLPIVRENPNRHREALILNMLGTTYLKLQNYVKAAETYQQNLAVVRQLGDRKQEVDALLNIGVAYLNLHDYNRAIESHQQSLAMARQFGPASAEAYSLSFLGKAYYELKDYAKVIEFYQQSLPIFRQLGDRQEEERALSHVGIAYLTLKNYPQATENFKSSLASLRELSKSPNSNRVALRKLEGVILASLAMASYYQADYAKAVEYSELCLPMVQQLGDSKTEKAVVVMLNAAKKALAASKNSISVY